LFFLYYFYVLYIQIGFTSFVVLYCTQKQELEFQLGKEILFWLQQKANDPWWSFTILPALRSSTVSGFVDVLQLNSKLATTAIKMNLFIVLFLIIN